MNTQEIIKYSIRSKNSKYNSTGRDSFVCLEINIPTDGRWIKRVYSEAVKINSKLNIKGANSSENRVENIAATDGFAGLIAEHACYEILKWRYGENTVTKPQYDESGEQIDIMLYNHKTIEVRSSCVKNGIDFAIFALNNKGQQYFDILGPYTNDYKKSESVKDYYMRVFYECDKDNFAELLSKPVLKLYITGGVTKNMMNDKALYKIKHLKSAGIEIKKESDYRVIPMLKSLDIKEFFEVLEKENEGLSEIRE